MISPYLHKEFTSRMDIASIKTIVECGSRDCLDTIAMLNYFNPDAIYSFECNPECITVCESNIRGEEKIVLIPKAVCNENKITKFYATDMIKSIDKNIGASSLLVHRATKGGYVQKEIQVQGIRLDTFMKEKQIKVIDLLCMDLQGAEHLALEGLGENLQNVRYIIAEVVFHSYYHGDKLIHETIYYLRRRGFKWIYRVGGDAFFKNKKL